VTGTQLVNFPSSEGAIGLLVDNGPLQYPDQYPAVWDDNAVYPLWVEDQDWRETFEQ